MEATDTSEATESRDPAERAETMLHVTDRLCAILTDENRHLSERRYTGIAETIEEKDRLCRAFELLIKRTNKHPEEFAALDEATRQTIRNRAERLQELIDENAKALKTAIDVHELLMKNIAEAAMECSPQSGAYSDRGHYGPQAKRSGQGPLPVTYNQIL